MTTTTATINPRAGTSRRMRLPQKEIRRTELVRDDSERRLRLIRKPEMTKKTSTPTNPPWKPGSSTW